MLFPNLHSLDLSAPIGVTPEHWRRLQEVAKEIRKRTSARCWFDTRCDEFCIGYQDSDGYIRLIDGFPAFHVEGRSSPNRFDPALDGKGVDDLVHLVHLARVDPNLKAKWRVAAQRSMDHDKAERKARFEEDIKPELQKSFNHTLRSPKVISLGA